MICQSERLQSVDTGSPITAQQDGGTKPTNSLGMKFCFADEGDSASFFKKVWAKNRVSSLQVAVRRKPFSLD